MRNCAHCGSEELKCLKTGFSFTAIGSSLGIHGELYGCKDCGEMTVTGFTNHQAWDTFIDASPDLKVFSTTSYEVLKLNPTEKFKAFMQQWNPTWSYK